MSQTHLFDAYVSDCLKRWGREFRLEHRSTAGVLWNCYPGRSTLYSAMVFHGREPVGTGGIPEMDAIAWLVEMIVSQISTYDSRMALILRAAFCARGSWAERMQIANSVLSRSERFLCGSRGIYYRTRDLGIDEVAWYLRAMGES